MHKYLGKKNSVCILNDRKTFECGHSEITNVYPKQIHCCQQNSGFY